MELDLTSVLAMTALTVSISGAVFITDTVVRRDDAVGRIWAGAFLAGPLALLAFLVWAQDRSAWWAVAIGNAAFVSTISMMWLGCRRYNERRMGVASAAVTAGAALVAVVVLVAGPHGGDWAGAGETYALLAVFGVLGCVECLRGALRATRVAWTLAVVLALHSAFCLVRLVVFVAAGPDSAFFVTWLSTIPASFVTVTLTIVALVTASVLRAGRVPIRGLRMLTGPRARTAAEMARATGADSGVLVAEQFWIALQGLLTRASWHNELVAVFAVRVDDLQRIATAFGTEAASDIARAWRESVRHHVPAAARVGEDGPSALLVSTVVVSAADARRAAERISQGAFEDLRTVPGAVLPTVGVGVALTDEQGWDATALVARARATSLGGEAVAGPADGLDPARP
ncbi:hypothetical protein [Microbacterium sp. KR10-403]|uniref:hypothetical protein n=1 Tax=Microbacterium sp. KR10-403 TaxID=3158581 RepID=UPI0032E44A63